MSSQENVYEVPEGLPEPETTACDHLPGMRMPSVALRSTAGDFVDLLDPDGDDRRLLLPAYREA